MEQQQQKPNPGDAVVITEGRRAGRKGVVTKYCSSVFPEYCKVKLDLIGRQRNQETIMIQFKDLQTIE